MSSRSIPAVVLLALLPLAAVGQGQPVDPTREEPLDVGFRESVARRLTQVVVTVSGPASATRGLTRDDFELTVAGRRVEEFVVDSACDEGQVGVAERKAAAEQAGAAEPVRAAVAARPRAPVHILFYFDQAHLTPMGRALSIEQARTLVERLAAPERRIAIVSSAGEIRTFTDFTADRSQLLEGLELLENDRRQWDTYPMAEDDRVAEVMDALRRGVPLAASVAQRLARNERWRTEKALHRLTLVLGRFAEREPPKIVVYFADTMRSKPGAHYLYLFSDRDASVLLTSLSTGAASARSDYDAVIREATARGVRLYTVQAGGVVANRTAAARPLPAMYNHGGKLRRTSQYEMSQSEKMPRTRRSNDAQDSLAGFAHETGGQVFVDGVGAKKIAEAIETDLGCYYVLSFDSTDLEEDASHALAIRVLRPKVKARSRTRLEVQGASRQLTSRLLSAFASPEASRFDGELETFVIPTDYRDGAYRVLIQVCAPGSQRPGAQWDLGVSLVSRGEVREDAAGRIAVLEPAVPIVLESEMRIASGPFEVVAVAHETTTNEIRTGRIEGVWPDPDEQAVSVTPIAIVQPAAGAFVRDGVFRGQGSLAVGDRRPVRPDLPTALVGLVCRNRRQGDTLHVERRLAGTETVEFPVVSLLPGEGRCTQIRDVVEPGTMTEGGFVYEVRVLGDDQVETAGARRAFSVVEQ